MKAKTNEVIKNAVSKFAAVRCSHLVYTSTDDDLTQDECQKLSDATSLIDDAIKILNSMVD